MFRIWKTGENWTSLVVSVFTPKDVMQLNRHVFRCEHGYDVSYLKSTHLNGRVLMCRVDVSRCLVWIRLRRDATEQFCWVASLGVNPPLLINWSMSKGPVNQLVHQISFNHLNQPRPFKSTKWQPYIKSHDTSWIISSSTRKNEEVEGMVGALYLLIFIFLNSNPI